MIIQETIKTLINDGDSLDRTQQLKTLIALVKENVYSAVPQIIPLLKSPDPSLRANAAYALGYLGINEKETVGNALINLLSDSEELVRSEAIEALGLLHDTRAIYSLKNLLRNDVSPLVRASAAEVIGELGDIDAIETLELSLLDINEDEAVRCYGANAIGILGNCQLLPTLESYIKSEISLTVKAELLGAKYWLGDKEALNILLNLLADADENLALHILNILADLKERKTPSDIYLDAATLGKYLTVIKARFPILEHQAEKLMAL